MIKYIKYLSVMLAAFLLVSCGEEKLDPNSQILDSNVEMNEFDEWLLDNYVTPYNIEFIYRMEYIESDMNYYLVPAQYEKSVQIAKLMIHLCLQAYDEVTGDKEFIRRNTCLSFPMFCLWVLSICYFGFCSFSSSYSCILRILVTIFNI